MHVLALTEEAVSAVNAILETSDAPDGAAMRISRAPAATNTDAPGLELQLTIVESPEKDDQVVENPPLFLAPEAAEVLDDKLLDAEIVDQQVRFMIAEQA